MTPLILRVICCVCQRVLIAGSAGAPISHGLCPACFATAMAEIEGAG